MVAAFFAFSKFAKWNGFIVPHVSKLQVVPVPSFQADYIRQTFETIVLNDPFEMRTMKRICSQNWLARIIH
jgi:hypothetical protein